MDTQLITQIAWCDEIERAKTDTNHPCYEIVNYQNEELGITDFQLPEPWNGDIGNAKILFISSNPKIDPSANQKDPKEYPTEKGLIDDLPSFFQTRFDEYTRFDGQKQKYWFNANKCVGWILGMESRDVNLLKDNAALTEVVHCKSLSDSVVKECVCLCARKWLDKVLAEFGGEYIVVVGKIAKACMYGREIDGKKIAYIPTFRGLEDVECKRLLKKRLQIDNKFINE